MNIHRSDDAILSVGIDIGTTTTHMVISRLKLSNSSRLNQAPRMTIAERTVVYRSPIAGTPVTTAGIIDAEATAALISTQYALAGVKPPDVETGAVIVTGESARLRNAEQVATSLSEFAGEFVVSSAGPRLESILAARGSGAVQASEARQATICNVDIGGGTTNIAVYQHGKLLDTACLALGGRSLRTDGDGRVVGGSAAGTALFAGGNSLADAVSSIASAIVSFMHGDAVTSAEVVADYALDRGRYQIDQYFISGGVGEMLAAEGSLEGESLFKYNDIGPMLALALGAELRRRSVDFLVPLDAIRATVIGAGMHSVQLSGSTIAAAADSLPLRDIPLVRLTDIEQSVESQLKNLDLNWSDKPVALHLAGLLSTDYETLSRWADRLSEQFLQLRGSQPLIAVAQPDVGMALGQMLRGRLQAVPIVVIDGIQLVSGDYIDIGKPLRANALPVVIKELIFC